MTEMKWLLANDAEFSNDNTGGMKLLNV